MTKVIWIYYVISREQTLFAQAILVYIHISIYIVLAAS